MNIAPSMSDAFRRVSEIWCNASGGSFGSGYYIGDGLVLTALHVLRSRGERLPNIVKVRPLGIADSGMALQPADVIWPRVNDLDSPDVADAALLRMSNISCQVDEDLAIGPPSQISTTGELNVSATGFPAFAASPNERRDTDQIRGTVSVGAGLVSMKYFIANVRGAANESIDMRREWRGMSGAGLLDDDRLIGILLARKSANSRYDFSGLRIDRLLSDETFAKIIGPHTKISKTDTRSTACFTHSERVGSSPEMPSLLVSYWDRMDHDLQDAFMLAAAASKREGKDYISTSKLFSALRRIGADPLPDMLSKLPRDAVAEPPPADISPNYSSLQSINSLSPCVTQAVSKLAPKVDRASVLSSEDIFVDIARHGTGKSTRRLRTHGVGSSDVQRLVSQLGWSVLER